MTVLTSKGVDLKLKVWVWVGGGGGGGGRRGALDENVKLPRAGGGRLGASGGDLGVWQLTGN